VGRELRLGIIDLHILWANAGELKEDGADLSTRGIGIEIGRLEHSEERKREGLEQNDAWVSRTEIEVGTNRLAHFEGRKRDENEPEPVETGNERENQRSGCSAG
jgi:hypothetical protein